MTTGHRFVYPMRRTPSRRWAGVRTLLVVAAFAATAMVGNAKQDSQKEQAKAPQRQMLFTIFKPIMHDIGSCRVQKATVISGPAEIKMANNKMPGKQWSVSLGQSTFKVTIEDATKLTLTNALVYAERIPRVYLRALEVVSEGEKAGLAFYTELGGAAAHGGQTYLNMIPLKPARAASVIVHETGHILEQRARNTDKDILDKWAEAAKADNIDVSHYGNHVNHEDVAEFARLYAFCSDRALGGGKLKELRELSPARFDLWERMLKLSGATLPDRTAEMPIEPNQEWQKCIAELDENIKAASAQS